MLDFESRFTWMMINRWNIQLFKLLHDDIKTAELIT